MPDEVAEQLGVRLDALDPAANIVVTIACAGCDRALAASVDLATFVARDLDRVVDDAFPATSTSWRRPTGGTKRRFWRCRRARRRRYVTMIITVSFARCCVMRAARDEQLLTPSRARRWGWPGRPCLARARSSESDNHRVAGHDADLLDDAGGARACLPIRRARRRAMSGRSRRSRRTSMASSRRSCRRSRRTSAWRTGVGRNRLRRVRCRHDGGVAGDARRGRARCSHRACRRARRVQRIETIHTIAEPAPRESQRAGAGRAPARLSSRCQRHRRLTTGATLRKERSATTSRRQCRSWPSPSRAMRSPSCPRRKRRTKCSRSSSRSTVSDIRIESETPVVPVIPRRRERARRCRRWTTTCSGAARAGDERAFRDSGHDVRAESRDRGAAQSGLRHVYTSEGVGSSHRRACRFPGPASRSRRRA